MTADPNAPETTPEGQPAAAPEAAPANAPVGADPAAPAGDAAADAGGAAPDPVAVAQQLAAEVGRLQAQLKDANERILRAHADMDNLRKRMEREREDTAKYAITKFACDIVGVSDNFQRAITSVPADAAAADTALKTLIEGVTMTESEFLKVLERHGVKRIDPLGQPFSPHQHQAMMEREDASVPAGTIVQVFQAGYVIDERVIRPAMVVVARGGAKAPKPAANGNGEAPGAGGAA